MSTGELWLVTGASKGLGLAIVEELLGKGGVNVHGYSRSGMDDRDNYTHHCTDLSDADAVAQLVLPQLPEDCEKVVLVNNAATLGEIKYVGSQDPSSIISAYQLNVVTPHLLCNQLIAAYPDKAKVIINIGSGAATSPYDGWNIYSTSKAALQMLTLVMEKEAELSGSELKAYAIAPGVLDTDMQVQIRETDESGFSRRAKFADLHREGNLRKPKQAADYIVMIGRGEFIPDETVYRLPI